MRPLVKFSVAAAGVAVAMCCDVPASYAYGDAPWCAVVNRGGTTIWECEYDSAEECAPNVTGGNRGFCNINPYRQPPPDRPAPYRRPVQHQ